MSVQLPDTISLRNKDSAAGRFWARCAKVKFLSRTRLRIFLDHLWSHNALSKPRRQSGAPETQLESEALLNFFRIFFEFFLGLKNVHNRESDRLYNCNAHLVATFLPRLQRFVFFLFWNPLQFLPVDSKYFSKTKKPRCQCNFQTQFRCATKIQLQGDFGHDAQK